MIGLKRGTVKLSPYDPRWKKLFLLEKSRLRKYLGKQFIGIEHIGSTAIPGLSAKPVIDVLVGVGSMEHAHKHIKEIEKTGYVWRPKFGRIDRHVVFARGDGVSNTNYLHLVRYRGKIWNDRLLFRDYLTKHKKYLKQYEKLKRDLVKEFSQDRKGYTEQKTEFVKKILKLASK